MADAAEGADAGADESEVDYDALPFNDTRYWTHFYDEDEPAFYDWCAHACSSPHRSADTPVCCVGADTRAAGLTPGTLQRPGFPRRWRLKRSA